MTSLTWTLSDISAYSSIKQPYQGHSHCFSALFTFQSNMKAALRAFALISRYQCKSAWRESGGTRPNLQTTADLNLIPPSLSGAAKTRGIMCNKASFFYCKPDRMSINEGSIKSGAFCLFTAPHLKPKNDGNWFQTKKLNGQLVTFFPNLGKRCSSFVARGSIFFDADRTYKELFFFSRCWPVLWTYSIWNCEKKKALRKASGAAGTHFEWKP